MNQPVNCPYCNRAFPAAKSVNTDPRGFRNHTKACALRMVGSFQVRPESAPMTRKSKKGETGSGKDLDKALDAALEKDGRVGPAPILSVVPAATEAPALPKKARGKKAIVAAKPEVATPASANTEKVPEAIPTLKTEVLAAPVMEKTLEQIADELPPAPASAEQKAVIDLGAKREVSLRSFATLCETTWKEYGVDQVALDKEMVTEKQVPGGTKKQGLGTTLAMHLAKHRAKIAKAADPTALAEAVRKAEQTVLDVALYLWAQGSATGPITQLSLSNSAKAAERLADSLEKMGKVINAQQQRERAARLREQAERAGQGLSVEIDKIKPKTTLADVKGKGGVDKPANTSGKCLCGCGAETKGNFKPGHDSKVHGLALKIARGQSADHLPMGAAEYVQKSKWLNPEERVKFLAHHNIKEG